MVILTPSSDISASADNEESTPEQPPPPPQKQEEEKEEENPGEEKTAAVEAESGGDGAGAAAEIPPSTEQPANVAIPIRLETTTHANEGAEQGFLETEVDGQQPFPPPPLSSGLDEMDEEEEEEEAASDRAQEKREAANVEIPIRFETSEVGKKREKFQIREMMCPWHF